MSPDVAAALDVLRALIEDVVGVIGASDGDAVRTRTIHARAALARVAQALAERDAERAASDVEIRAARSVIERAGRDIADLVRAQTRARREAIEECARVVEPYTCESTTISYNWDSRPSEAVNEVASLLVERLRALGRSNSQPPLTPGESP